MNHEIRGWNECLITYVLAASSPTYPISSRPYQRGWAAGRDFKNGRQLLRHRTAARSRLWRAAVLRALLIPRARSARSYRHLCGLLEAECRPYADQSRALRPQSARTQGLWASLLGTDRERQLYWLQCPFADNDLGVIAPTAALSSFPYTPDHSMEALRHFYDKLGKRLWGDYGFTDAFSEEKDWFDKGYLAIDQGPIIVMIENYRSGLMWDLFMSCPEIRDGLARARFHEPAIRGMTQARTALVAARRHLSDLSALVSGQQWRRHRRSQWHHRARRLSPLARRRRGLDIADLSFADGRFRLRHFRLHRHRSDLRHARRFRPACWRRCTTAQIRVILDFVPNHTSIEHEWFQASRQSRRNPKRDWYIWRDPAPDGGPPNNWLSYAGGERMDVRCGDRAILLSRLPGRAARPQLAQSGGARTRCTM